MHFNPLSLADLVESIESGDTAPRDAILAADARIDAIDGEVKAFVRRASQLALEDGSGASGPLAGVPLGFKDIFDTADMPTEYGSPIHKGFRPSADAALVAIARAKGATVMGKTATTEFAFLEPAKTRNPVNLGHTPGGSSSGSAAAVASGMVAGSFGSQTAGSVIRPAAFCGVAGFKPSFRLMPTVGMKTFAWTLDTVGLFAKGVRDVALLADLLTGRDLRVTGEAQGAPLRIGLYRSGADDQLEPAMVDAWDEARRLLEAAGASVHDIAEPGELANVREAQILIQLYEGAIALAHERRVHRDQLSERLAAALDEGASVEPAAYDDARRVARRSRRAVTAMLEGVDAILAPSALGAAPASLSATGDPVMNRIWTLTGNPCVNVAGLADADGMPLGLSVVTRFGKDKQAPVVKICGEFASKSSGILCVKSTGCDTSSQSLHLRATFGALRS